MSRTVKVLLVLFVLFLLLLVAIDIGAKIAVERISAQALRDSDEINAGGVETSVDSFPFLGRLLVSGETSFSIALDDVTDQGVRIDRIEFDVDGLVFNRGEAFDGRARIDDVDRVRASVVIEEDTITQTAGVQVDLEPGSATAAGVTVGVAVVGREVQASVPGVGAVSFAIPSTDYLPCEPALAIVKDQVEVSCTTDSLPPLVNEALGEVNP
jgi:hypothetical protein